MNSFIKNIKNTLFNIEESFVNSKNTIKYYKPVPIDNTTKVYDEIKKCWKKNINDTSKLYILIDNLSKYKLYDFLIDLHKLPHNLIEIKNYLLISCIILIIILILIIVFFILIYNKM